MDSVKSLGAPLKRFTSCVSGTNPTTKRTAKKSQPTRRNSFARRKSIGRRKSLPCSSQKVPDSWLRVYQAELQKERKRQQAMLAKKNAQRSVGRTQFRGRFRSQHCLPRHATPTKKQAAKDDSFFGAFQGLSLDGMIGGTRGSPAIAIPTGGGGDECKVM